MTTSRPAQRRLGDVYRPLSTVVYEELRDEIVLGVRPPGSRLSEIDLAETFGVSRGPVRTALLELERAGLVDVSPRRGSVVSKLTARDVAELFGLRIVLEKLAAETACSLDGPSPVLSDMTIALDRLERAQAEGDARGEMVWDLEFHRLLCRASANGRLLRAWEALADQLRLVIAAVQRADPSVASHKGEHSALLRALERCDASAAVAAVERHLGHSQETMIASYVDAQPGGPPKS